jgi:hypothetical protein
VDFPSGIALFAPSSGLNFGIRLVQSLVNTLSPHDGSDSRPGSRTEIISSPAFAHPSIIEQENRFVWCGLVNEILGLRS